MPSNHGDLRAERGEAHREEREGVAVHLVAGAILAVFCAISDRPKIRLVGFRSGPRAPAPPVTRTLCQRPAGQAPHFSAKFLSSFLRGFQMTALSKARALAVSGFAAIAITTLSASARAEVLFDSLSSENSGVVGDNSLIAGGGFAASFDTGASAVRLTDVALLLNTTFSLPGDTFTVSLVGGFPLADITFESGLGLVFGSPLPVLGSETLPISDLSGALTVEQFNQLANITLQPDAFYAISVRLSSQSQGDQATVGWGTTADDSGTGVEDGYNASIITDNGFFPNKPTPPPNNGGPIFQMEISGVATPEPSTWALMLVGLGILGLLAHRRRIALALNRV